MDSNNTRHETPPQTDVDADDETLIQNEISTVHMAMPFLQVNMLSHSKASSAAAHATTTNPMMEGDEIPPPKADSPAPPPHEVATKLPNYEEPGNIRLPQQPLTVLPTDTEGAERDPKSERLGTDFMFFKALLVAFIFNWIGFLILRCLYHNIASRYGALAGFGLSLAKATFILIYYCDIASRDNSWWFLWWMVMAVEVLICICSILHYLNIKRGWRLLSDSAQERILYFF